MTVVVVFGVEDVKEVLWIAIARADGDLHENSDWGGSIMPKLESVNAEVRSNCQLNDTAFRNGSLKRLVVSVRRNLSDIFVHIPHSVPAIPKEVRSPRAKVFDLAMTGKGGDLYPKSVPLPCTMIQRGRRLLRKD